MATDTPRGSCVHCCGNGYVWVPRFDGDEDPDEYLCPKCGGDGMADQAPGFAATGAESSRQRAVDALDRALEAGGIHQPFVKWDELIEALEAEGWEFRG